MKRALWVQLVIYFMIPLGLALLHTIVVPHFLMLLDTITVLDAIKNFIGMLAMSVIIYGYLDINR